MPIYRVPNYKYHNRRTLFISNNNVIFFEGTVSGNDSSGENRHHLLET